jgi:chemotaxis signal transduction protein
MNQYLQLRCGPYRLLLDTAHVVEIGAVPAADESGSGWRLWREQNLRNVDLTAFLGAPAAPVGREQVVLRSGADALCVIDVDQVQQIVEFPPERFAAIADCSARLAGLVDGVALAADTGDCLLRLRHPFAWSEPVSGDRHE